MAKTTPARIRISVTSEILADRLQGMSCKKRSLYIEAAMIHFDKYEAGQTLLATLYPSTAIISPPQKAKEVEEAPPLPAKVERPAQTKSPDSAEIAGELSSIIKGISGS